MFFVHWVFANSEGNLYDLNKTDKILINKLVYKINNIIQEKDSSYKQAIVSKLTNLSSDRKYTLKYRTILLKVANEVDNMQILSEIKKEQEYISMEEFVSTYTLENIDIQKVKDKWLLWNNEVREWLWKKAYSYDSKLEKTAYEWSNISKNSWIVTHKRSSWDSYYDYYKISNWFKDRGVVCKNVYWVTYSENIGYWYYSCNDWECSDELIDSLKSTFDFYMAEKYKSSQTHYLSLINSYFTKIWLWIDISNSWNWKYKYYLTVHYCTEVKN